MNNRHFTRPLQFERLQSRQVLAAQSLVVWGTSPTNFAVSTSLDAAQPNPSDSLSPLRQVSIVKDNAIETLSLHPQGAALTTTTQTLVPPPNAVDVVIEKALDEDTAFGYAQMSDGTTTAVLWMDASTTVRLGDAVPLAGYQRSDRTVMLAYERNSLVFVERFDLQGNTLSSISFDGSIYSSARITSDGMVLLGTENEQPVAARIDEAFSATEVELAKSTDTKFAAAIGVSRFGQEQYFAGNMIDASNQACLAWWDLQGNQINQGDFEDIVALKVSGKALLVDTLDGIALLLRDPGLAAALDIAADQPVLPSNLPILQSQGLSSVSLTEVIENEGELFLGVTGIDSQGQLWQGMLTAATEFFPSAWQFSNPLDVNRSGQVTALDALLVINELNSTGARVLTASNLSNVPSWDVNGDGFIAPLDVLLIINHLNVRT